MADDPPRKSSKRTAFIAVGAAVALAAAVASGVLLGRSQTVADASTPSAAGALASSSAAAASPRLATTTAAPRPSVTRLATAPAAVPAATPPAMSAPRNDTMPGPVAPPPIAPLPVAAPPQAPRPVPTCPPDAGVVLSITGAQLLYEGTVLDQYTMTLTLDNRLQVPVTLVPTNSIKITSVRATGAEMGSGFVSLPEMYEVKPGKTTFVLTGTDAATIYHGFGSPVTAFKLTGTVSVTNSYPDQLDRGKFCDYRNMAMGAPLGGSWGT